MNRNTGMSAGQIIGTMNGQQVVGHYSLDESLQRNDLVRLPRLQAHSSPGSLKNSPSCHPQMAQGKQSDQLRRVLGESFVANLGEPKLAFDDPERVFHFGPYTGLELLSHIRQGSQLRLFIQRSTDFIFCNQQLFRANKGLNRSNYGWRVQALRPGRLQRPGCSTLATGLWRSLKASGMPEPSSGRRYILKASVTSVPLEAMNSSSITRVLPATASSGNNS